MSVTTITVNVAMGKCAKKKRVKRITGKRAQDVPTVTKTCYAAIACVERTMVKRIHANLTRFATRVAHLKIRFA